MKTVIGWVPRKQTRGFESRRFCGDTCGVKEAGWAEGSWPGVKLSEEPESGPRDGVWPWRCPWGTHLCAVTSPHASPGESRLPPEEAPGQSGSRCTCAQDAKHGGGVRKSSPSSISFRLYSDFCDLMYLKFQAAVHLTLPSGNLNAVLTFLTCFSEDSVPLVTILCIQK